MRHFELSYSKAMIGLAPTFDFLLIEDYAPLMVWDRLFPGTELEWLSECVLGYESSNLRDSRVIVDLRALTSKQKAAALDWLKSYDTAEFGVVAGSSLDAIQRQLAALDSLALNSICYLSRVWHSSDSMPDLSFWPGIARPDGASDGILTIYAPRDAGMDLQGLIEVEVDARNDRLDGFCFWKRTGAASA
jgi:hypothetical protein